MSEEKDKSQVESLKRRIIFRILWWIATIICASVRIKVEGNEKLHSLKDSGKGGLVLVWHGSTMLPIYYYRHHGFYSIVSVSRDGQLQNKMLESRGFKTIRGSSGRHGARALLEAVRKLNDGCIIAYSPDGQKPAKKVESGTIYMAKKTGCPILPVGVACYPCKRVNSWDKHMIPFPFSKAAIVFGDMLIIDNSENELDAEKRIEDAINRAEARANEIIGRKV